MTKINDNIFILDERQKTVGVASNSSPFSLPYYVDTHLENLQGVSTYTFTSPATHPEATKLKINGHIIRQIYNGDYVLFTIKELTAGHNSELPEIQVFCENSAISELLEDVQRPETFISTSLETVLTSVISNTLGWSLGYVDYDGSRDIIFEEYITVLEAIRFIESEFHMEVYFTVELIGNEIVGKKINMVKERGNRTGVRFEYGQNLQGVTRFEDSSGIITAIIAVGKGDTSKSRINLTSVTAFDDGDFYKDSNTDWIGSNEALQRWSKDGSHIYGIFIDDEADTTSRLKSVALRELGKRVVPKVHYSTSVRLLKSLIGYESKEVDLGDVIVVLDKTFTPPIAIEGRVQGLEISYTNDEESKVDLGNHKSLALAVPPEITRMQNAISLKEEEWKASGTTVEVESRGGNVFMNGVGTTTLNARVYVGAVEKDLLGTEYLYKWYKYDSNGDSVLNWGGATHYKTGKTLPLSNIDVDSKATFIIILEKD